MPDYEILSKAGAEADIRAKTFYATKRATLVLGTPLGTVASDALYRTIVRLPVTTKRWRF